MFEKPAKLRGLTPLLLLALVLACETGSEPPAADEVTATLQQILSADPSLTCTEFEVLNESGVGATFRYYTVRATCAASRGTGDPLLVQKHYELRYDRVPDGWRFKVYRAVGQAFAEDPASRGTASFTANPGARRLLLLALGIPTAVVLIVLILWMLQDHHKVLPAVARRLRLSRKKQPHRSKDFDSINPLD